MVFSLTPVGRAEVALELSETGPSSDVVHMSFMDISVDEDTGLLASTTEKETDWLVAVHDESPTTVP